MIFLTPWLLLGTLLAGVPLVIHLLNKPRYRRQPWGAMMFLQAAVQRRSRTIKLQQLLLLLLRMLLLVLLALALARPVLRSGGSGGGQLPVTHVLLLDGSYSMRQGEHKDNAFYRMMEEARAIVERMRDQDNAVLIWVGNKPRALTPRPVFNRAELRRILDELEPGWETADVPRALEQALWLLGQSSLPRHRIYILGDLQRNGWHGRHDEGWSRVGGRMGEQEIQPSVYVAGTPPDQEIRNVAITGIRSRYPLLDTHRPAPMVIDFHNYAADPMEMEMTVRVGMHEVEHRSVRLAPGVNTETFEHHFTTPGSHAVRVTIREDDLLVDNEAVLAVEVLRTVPVLVIEGHDPGGEFVSGGTLMQWALEAGGVDDDNHLFTVERLDETALDRLSYADLIRHKSILLVNVRSLPTDFEGLLKQYVREGGGLLVAAGGRSRPELLNRLFEGDAGLLPARLLDVQHRGEEPLRPSFPAGPATEVLQLFDVSRTRTLGEVRVNSFRAQEPAEHATVAGLLGDAPYLTVKPYHEGSVALWSSGLDLQESNFSVVPDFVPLLQNLVFYLSSRVVPPIHLAQGETLVYSYTRARAFREQLSTNGTFAATRPEQCRVVAPDGSTNVVELITRMGESIGYFGETIQPGVYEVLADGVPPRYYSVRLPENEGDPARLEREERNRIRDAVDAVFVESRQELDAAIMRESVVRDLVTLLILLALAALVADTLLGGVLSGRGRRHGA